jgi:hypothetical protein
LLVPFESITVLKALRRFMKRTSAALLFSLLSLAPLPARALDRPGWMDNPGIVMAGNWEEPSFRARRFGQTNFMLPPEKVAAYQREHSPEMIARLRELGVNFLMIHGYKGAGMATEAAGMEDARQFAALAHKAGLRVGTYIGGTMLYERLFFEEPLAPQWQAFGPDGGPIFYNDSQRFRYAAVRNHPGFIDYLQEPTRYAVKVMGSDLVHYDNFGLGAASYDSFSKARFRAFLEARGQPPAYPPPKTNDAADPLVRDWRDYKCQALAEHYAAMSRFIRSLDLRCAVEGNPGGVGNEGRASAGIDFPRLLPLGNAFWDEAYGPDSPHSKPPGIRSSRIRSMKVGRLYNNSVFCYTDTPLDAAESMAFNLNCLGCVTWFEWGEMISLHEDRPTLPCLKDYIRFFNRHQALYRNAETVADVAVLRTFADQNFGPRRYYPIEQALMEGHVAWRIIFDEQLDALQPYRVVVVPDKEWLTEAQQQKLEAFAARGGKVIPAAEVREPKALPASLQDKFRILVDAPSSVAIELCQQDNPPRVLIHLVNYDPASSLKNIPIKLRLAGPTPGSARMYSPEHPAGRRLALKTEWDLCVCVLPELKVYTVVVVNVGGL